MAKYESTETAKIAATTSDKYATFDGGIQKLYVVADADVFIDFDRVAQINSSLLIKANQVPVELDFNSGNIQQIHAICASTANVYLCGIRGTT